MSNLIETNLPGGVFAPEVLPPGPFVDNVIPHLHNWLSEGNQAALLTLVNVEGASPRPVGSQLAVTDTGQSIGLISGGCVEPALVLEAQACIASGQTRLVRYGKDSDYFDIQLPCGSGIDLFIQPLKSPAWVTELQQLLVKRQLVQWRVSSTGLNSIRVCKQPPALNSNGLALQSPAFLNRAELHSSFKSFSRFYTPKHRLVVVGKGSIYDYFLQLLQAFDVEVLACSTQYSKEMQWGNTRTIPLTDAHTFDGNWLDEYSSLVLLSHDHSWEVPILTKALTRPAVYIAALGSRKAHRQRLQLLRDEGLSQEELQRIQGPAGLPIGSTTPPEIALSILSQWVQQCRSRALTTSLECD